MEIDPLLGAALAFIAGLIGAGSMWLLAARTQSRLRQNLAVSEAEHAGLLARLEAQQSEWASERDRFDARLSQLQEANTSLQTEAGSLKARGEERERSLQEQLKLLENQRASLRSEFENLSREFLAARSEELRDSNKENIGAILKPLAERIEGFQSRVNQVHTDMVQNSATLVEQIRSLEKVGLSIGSDAANLTRALKGDKKLVGNWGEAQLERTLELAGLTKGEHYETQSSYRDEYGQRHVPDFVVKLPGAKNIVLDSKVSLVDYEAAIAAEDDAARELALKRHGNAVKAHIDGLAEKQYAQLPGMASPDFVLMFMPVEPAYIEVMKHHRDLFSYGYQKGVVMVSHSTLMPILRTVSNLWMMERSNTEAREISERAGEVFNSVCLVAERLQGLGQSLQTATKKYNDTVTAVVGRQGLHGKVERFQSLSQKASKSFPDQLLPLPPETDAHQLSAVLDVDKNSES